MSEITLCMVVKDEINRIGECLEAVVDVFADVVIVDTGSTDGTQLLLRERFGIEPLQERLLGSRCFCKSDARNRAFERARTPWILSIDADERINRDALLRFCAIDHPEDIAGYFGRWQNHVNEDVPFEDYKLFLFRQGMRKRGLVHENVQVDVRMRGGRAVWLNDLHVGHFPEPAKHAFKTAFYRHRLDCAIKAEPEWYRYYWFKGYMDFSAGDWSSAVRNLAFVATAESQLFPVETLNSLMVLAEIHARQGKRAALDRTIDQALHLHDRFQLDFEVAINFRLRSWFEAAREHCDCNMFEEIRAYRFAH